MATISHTQKSERVLRFFIALRQPRIAQALQQHGFGNDDLNEGWNLLRALSIAKLDERPIAKASTSPTLIERLDTFENLWFPIATATLERRYPAAYARLFNNLSQTTGPAVTVSVFTFVERLENLDKDGQGRPWAEGKAARDVLVRRGLTTKVIDEAKALLKEVPQVEPMPVVEPSQGDLTAKYQQAEDSLWAWYLEWSSVARAVIKDGRLLNAMGFDKPGRRHAKSGVDAKEDLETSDTSGD